MPMSAFPGVLLPDEWREGCLVDGSVLENLPVDLVRALGG